MSLPIDPNVILKKLPNGLTYYLRKNKNPQQRLELRLVINIGSVIEAEHQRGYAHFIEHLAFRKTRHFPDQELMRGLEAKGLVYGQDINAYTRFDETEYKLHLPTDDPQLIETAFQIFQDWLDGITFDEQIIDEERHVILEEKRLQDTSVRLQIEKQHRNILFKHSPYADHLPIGDEAALINATVDDLRDFYQTWYRPDLTAVIAVGDFDLDHLEMLIRQYLEIIQNQSTIPRSSFDIPQHPKTRISIATHSEITVSHFAIYHQHEFNQPDSLQTYRALLLESLVKNMILDRFHQLLLSDAQPPLLQVNVRRKRLTRTQKAFMIWAEVDDSGMRRGIETALVEIERIRRFGFKNHELEDQKKTIWRDFERDYNEHDKLLSVEYVVEYVNHFLRHIPIPGVVYEYELHQKILNELTLDDVNQFIQQQFDTEHRIITITHVAHPNVPSNNDIESIINQIPNRKLNSHLEQTANLVLMTKPPDGGEIIKETFIDAVDVYEWQLSNGCRVILKPTNFENDKVLFFGYHLGGHSLANDANNAYISAANSAQVVRLGGVGDYNFNILQKKLAAKLVTVTPYMDLLYHGFSGNCAPAELETLLQVVNLYFTRPRRDRTAFESFKMRAMAHSKHRKADPETVFGDDLKLMVRDHHVRARPVSPELIDALDFEDAFSFYQQRFAGATDFNFFLVGNFDPVAIKSKIQTYLGGLSAHEFETWQDVNLRYVDLTNHHVFSYRHEEKSVVVMMYTGSFRWSLEISYLFSALQAVLEMVLRERLRETLGKTYQVNVTINQAHYPQEEYLININFTCAPKVVDNLINHAFAEIETLKIEIPETYIIRVKEGQRRKRDVGLKTNQFWLDDLFFCDFHQLQPSAILEWYDLIENLSSKQLASFIQSCL